MKSHKKNQPLQPRIGDGVPKHVPLLGRTPVVVVHDGVTTAAECREPNEGED